MADWIHCNSCFGQPGVGRMLFLTNCGHLFCQECLPSDSNIPCKICNETFRSQPLNAELTPEVAAYFTEPIDLLQKMQKQIDLIYQVVEFQQNHRNRFTAYNRKKMQNNDARMSETLAVVERMKDIVVENQKLKKEIESLRKENCYMKMLLKSLESRPSPNFLTRAHGDTPAKDPSSFLQIRGLAGAGGGGGGDDLSQRSVQKPGKRTSEPDDGFVMKTPNKLPVANSVSNAQFSFRTPNSATHISPGLARLSVRTPPINGKLGEIPHYPTSRNQVVYTPTMPAVRDSPRSMETNESTVVNATSKSAPSSALPSNAADRLLARFQANYPNLKP